LLKFNITVQIDSYFQH